jgi:hypothetical protein
LETARRLRAFLSGVFRFGVAIGVAEHDPAALLRGAIASPRPTHRAAIVDRDGFAKLMQAIAAYEGRGSQVKVRQGIPSLGEATKDFEKRVFAGLLDNGGTPFCAGWRKTRWCVSTAT